MTDFNVLSAAQAGVAPAFVAATASDRFKPGSASTVFIYIKNTAGAPVDIQIADPTSQPPSGLSFTVVGGGTKVAVTVPATNGERLIKISNPGRFVDANGWINLTYSTAPTATVMVFA